MSNVVIVESPAKAKTIEKFLGPGNRVVATYGHIRDLPKKNGSVDTEHGFFMHYEVPRQSTRHVEALVKSLRGAKQILLATDPDREGEAISWHVLEILRERGLLENTPVSRVVFHEITRGAIQEAMSHARAVDMNLVNAQQARRALDYLVGFTLSPLLWRKVRRGLSAGRVQSVALRLVCEREREIAAFQVREYWSITSQVSRPNEPPPFAARLAVAEGRKLDRYDIPDQARATALVDAVRDAPLFVTEVERKESQRNPAPPFITSTLQQEASRKLGFSAKRTMALAQQLYEGLEVPTPDGGKEVAGLITYMRTDSVNLAQEAVAAMRALITSRYGNDFLPRTPRKFKSSAKNAQEAHEAIRPTECTRHPDMLRNALNLDQLKLYELIWKRTIASQMASARIDQMAVNLAVGQANAKAPYQFRATGSAVAFPGFMRVYQEGKDAVSAQDRNDDESETMLPPLEVGQELRQLGIEPKQHFTEPPPRYTEATLVKALENFGIGRPSTYAPTMTTLQDRGYVRLEKRQFFPEDVGLVVNDFLVEHFPRYVDFHFTAHLEDDLDAVSRGERTWVPLLEEFWSPFRDQVKEKEQTTRRSDITSEVIDEPCPQCGKPLSIKLGKFGRFKACTGFPECRFTEPLRKEGEEAKPVAETVLSDRTCEKCGAVMAIKEGRYGKYLACTGFPACRNMAPLKPPQDSGVVCPQCGKGTFLEKKSRYGKLFYSCSAYPACRNALWNKPEPRPCPKCGAPFVTVKVTKRRGTEHVCAVEGCGWSEVVQGPQAAAEA
ncbi:MAG: type I DNA topoisomerase [Magnetococcales bacterium]|nr:type I DNA topoisomerase [Magnetococcales bacterium]